MTAPTLDGFRVVDCHVHVQPWHQLRPDVARVMTAKRADLPALETWIADPDAFRAHLDAAGVARVALINYPAPEVMGFDLSVNDWVAAYRDRLPDRVIAFGGLHVRAEDDPADTIAHALDALKLDGIKIHPPHQLVPANAHAEPSAPGHRLLALLYEACQDRGVPVMIHTGTSVFPGARGKYGDPLACDDVAVDFPRLPLILAHAGRPLWMETAVHLVRRHPNVFVDLSGIPPQSLLDYLPKLEALSAKCLWGTDWPSPGVQTLDGNVRAFLDLPLSDEAKRRILSANADALFPPR